MFEINLEVARAHDSRYWSSGDELHWIQRAITHLDCIAASIIALIYDAVKKLLFFFPLRPLPPLCRLRWCRVWRHWELSLSTYISPLCWAAGDAMKVACGNSLFFELLWTQWMLCVVIFAELSQWLAWFVVRCHVETQWIMRTVIFAEQLVRLLGRREWCVLVGIFADVGCKLQLVHCRTFTASAFYAWPNTVGSLTLPIANYLSQLCLTLD